MKAILVLTWMTFGFGIQARAFPNVPVEPPQGESFTLPLSRSTDTPFSANDPLKILTKGSLQVSLHHDFWLKSSAFGEKTFLSLYTETGTKTDLHGNKITTPVVVKSARKLNGDLDCSVYAIDEFGKTVQETTAIVYDTKMTLEKVSNDSKNSNIQNVQFRTQGGNKIIFGCTGPNVTVGAFTKILENAMGDVATNRDNFKLLR